MPHLRNRHVLELLKSSGRFWPVVGLLGLRQSGKSTLFRDVLDVGTYVTLDDENALEDAKRSSMNFLQKLPLPLVIDEVQKAPGLFDSIKLHVDNKRKPGTFFLTGSSQFSARLGIRESLTGRIGILYFYPLTLAEIHNKGLDPTRANPVHTHAPRFSIGEALKTFESGCLPVPVFTRKPSLVRNYFQSWMETTLLRDASRAYGKGYDPDLAHSLIGQMGNALRNGEYATLKHFSLDSRKLRRYLQAFEDIFLVQKCVPCDGTVGGDSWTFSDSGIASFVCRTILGEGTHLSLLRVFILKEVRALSEYSDKRIRLEYFKTARGAPVDFIWNGTPVKISIAPRSQIEYDLRTLRSAMRHLKSKNGILMTGGDGVEADGGITVVPWVHYS